jgi:hypothetical protein
MAVVRQKKYFALEIGFGKLTSPPAPLHHRFVTDKRSCKLRGLRVTCYGEGSKLSHIKVPLHNEATLQNRSQMNPFLVVEWQWRDTVLKVKSKAPNSWG